MTNCRNVPVTSMSKTHRFHPTGRETLVMPVIVEEPPNMRESCLKEQAQPRDDITSSHGSSLETLDERPRRAIARDSGYTFASAEALVDTTVSMSRADATSATPSSSLDEHDDKVQPLQKPSRRFCAEPPPNQSFQSRTRQRESLTPRYVRDSCSIPLHHERSPPSEAEYTPRLKLSNSSSPEEEKHWGDHHERLYLRNTTSQFSGTRSKASSVPQSKASAPSKGGRRQSTSSWYRSPDERPPSKSSVRLDSFRSPVSTDRHESHRKVDARQAPRSRSSSLERCYSKSTSSIEAHGERQMPPFRRPSSHPVEDDVLSLKSSAERLSASAEEPLRHRMPSRHVAATNSGRATPSSLLNPLAPCSEQKLHEDRRLRAFRDVNPPPRQHSVSNMMKPMVRTDANEQRQVASCPEPKMPADTPNSKLLSLKPPTNKLHPSSTSSSPRHPTRTRSTSLLLKKPPTPASPGALSSSRSSSVSSFSSLASASPDRMSAPEFPLRLRHYEGRFLNRRSQTLFYFSLFPPEKMPMRGVVLCLHGLGDHCRRNVKLYERLCREGFGVITYDLLNHGVSDLDEQKTRAHISDFNHLVEDTNDFITFAKRSIYRDALRYWRTHHHSYSQESNSDMTVLPELPLVIAGTSFGSLIGIHTILSGQHEFDAAVWGSPTVGVTWNPLLWAESKLSKPLAKVVPKAKLVPAIQYDLLSRDPKFLRRFKADPLTSMDMMTTRTGHEALQAIIQLHEDVRVTDPRSAFCAVPTLFLSGSADGVSDQQAAIKFFATMGNFDKEFKLFDGLFHLVYEEPEKEDVFRYLAQWLHRRFPASKSADKSGE